MLLWRDDGSIIAGTWAGVVRLRRGRLVEDPLLSQLSGRINAIERDTQGRLWFAGSSGLYSVLAGRIKRYGKADGLAGDNVTALLASRAGPLWVGTTTGLFKIENGICSPVLAPNGPGSAAITALHEDAGGKLWIGTYDFGLFQFNAGKMTRYTTAQGLIHESVLQILEDDKGFLWIGCPIGIYRISKRDLNDFAAGRPAAITPLLLSKPDGLATGESGAEGQPAAFKGRNGKLWFATDGGIAEVDPDAVASNPKPPPVFIEEVRLDGRTVPGEGLVMPPGRQNLEIRYTALSFINSEQIRFRYKLEGEDQDWVEAGRRRVAYYAHLPAGSHKFDVIAANIDGVWHTQGASISFTVLPPFYATWWFRLLAAILIMGALTAAWRARTRLWERRQLLQQAFSRQVIASQENERKRIAAELHDSLAQRLIIIKNTALLSLQSGSQNGAAGSLEEISSEASQAISEVREISYNLRPHHLDRLGLTKAIEVVIRKTAGASGIPFSTHIECIDELLPKDTQLHFYRLLQECLNNVVKHSGATGANVTIERELDRLVMIVQDNGRGFAAEEVTEHTGFGLTGLSERAKLIGGKAEVRSSPGQGTQVRVEINTVTI